VKQRKEIVIDRIKHCLKKIAIIRGAYALFRRLVLEEISVNNPFGRRNDQPVYIIRRYGGAGFFSNFLFVLGHIIYAEEHGYVPVVDMKHYTTPYNEKKKINGTRNAWEYYFEQPAGVSLKEVYQKRRIILSNGNMLFDKVPYYSVKESKFPDYDEVEKLRPYIQKYISVKPELQQEAEAFVKSLRGSVLGVHIRGTDMNYAPDHPRPPSVEMFAETIDKLEDQYQHILLCTDEQEILEKMKARYGEKIVFSNAYRSEDSSSIHNNVPKTHRALHRYMSGREVMIDMLLLSKCGAIVCGYSNVPYAAILMNGNKYDSVHLLKNSKKI